MNATSAHWGIVRASLSAEKERAFRLGSVEESAFLPAALEIIERPVSPTARATSRVLLVGLAATIAWLMLGRIDIVASAHGKLIPADNVKLVQSAGAGIVRAILVRDGQHVRKGQPLVELDPTVSTAEVAQARDALETAELDAERARSILAALDGRGIAFSAPLGTAPGVAATQLALVRARVTEIEAGALGNASGRTAAAAAEREARLQAIKLGETLPLLDEQIEANERLLEKGYVSKLKVIEMRRQRLATARDREIALQTADRAAAQLAGAGSLSVQNRAEARAKVLTDLATAEAEAKLRREELTKATQRSRLQRLIAPARGTVTQLGIHTVGGVVEAAKPIMVIVPDGGRLALEAKVLNKDVGFVAPGQPVAVKLEAFPFTRFGTIPGVIDSVSPDALEDQNLGLVYSVRVRLKKAGIRTGDAGVPLSPGMAATADIKTGSRTILSYLLEPVDLILEGGRER